MGAAIRILGLADRFFNGYRTRMQPYISLRNMYFYRNGFEYGHPLVIINFYPHPLNRNLAERRGDCPMVRQAGNGVIPRDDGVNWVAARVCGNAGGFVASREGQQYTDENADGLNC